MKEHENVCKCDGCKCIATRLTLVLSACTLIGGAILGTCIFKKVNTMHKMVIEAQYGSAENFNQIFDATVTEDYLSQKDEETMNILNEIKGEETNNEQEDSKDSNSYNDIDTSAAMNYSKWDENAEEAGNLFGIGGTPGNVIINLENGEFKVIGGAYPQSSFEAVIAQMRAGEQLLSDDIGNAGSLSKDQIKSLLDNTYYYLGNDNAKIVIVEYSDLLCPYCQRHYNARTIENIVEEDQTIALVFKNMPLISLHPNAPLGAKGAECAGILGGAEAYYSYIHEAFQKSDFSASTVVNIAENIGLNTNDFIACFES